MLITVFAAVALLLAAVGIYGVMSYAVAQRTQEIGIRMALGAERQDILRMVLRHGSLMAVTGIGLGLVVALGLARLITSLLFQVSATDPPTFSIVPVVLIARRPAGLLHPGPARHARRSAGGAAVPVGRAAAARRLFRGVQNGKRWRRSRSSRPVGGRPAVGTRSGTS